jgi:hypothetical protein
MHPGKRNSTRSTTGLTSVITPSEFETARAVRLQLPALNRRAHDWRFTRNLAVKPVALQYRELTACARINTVI